MFKKRFLSIFLVIALLALTIAGCSSETKNEPKNEESQTSEQSQNEDKQDDKKEEAVSMIVYSGAGLKRAMEDIKVAFEEKENVKIEFVYAGAGQLLSQIETSGKGDVFVTGSENSYNVAKDKGFANEGKLIAHHTPTIAVQKGNPKGIKNLNDLAQSGLKIALGDAKANAVGKTAEQIMKKNSLESIKQNVVTEAATVNEIVTAVATGQVDAAIVTEDAIRFNDKVEMVDIPKDQNIDQIIPACTLKSSEHQELAQKLVDFIASEEGKAIFEKQGYKTLK